MDHFDITINRLHSHSRSIAGELSVNGRQLCSTLELAWRWNARDESCIPNGRYQGLLRYDHADRWRIELLGVPGRSHVQIHVGNYPRETQGCVLVGATPAGNAVLDSKIAYERLKAEFYGTRSPVSSPLKTIRVEFKGIQATPWGDYPARRGTHPTA